MKKSLLALAWLAVLVSSAPVPGAPFVRGDSTGDGVIDLSDGVKVLSLLFLGGDAPACREAFDANDDSAVDLSDGIYILSFLFTGGRPIPPPSPECGADPTPDGLGCTEFPLCPSCTDPQVLTAAILAGIAPEFCAPPDQVVDAGLATVTVCPTGKATPCGDAGAVGCKIILDQRIPAIDLAASKVTVHVEGTAKAFPVVVTTLGSGTDCSLDMTFSADVVIGLVLDPPAGGAVRVADVLDPVIENPAIEVTASGGLLCKVLETQAPALVSGLVPLLETTMGEVVAEVRPGLVGTSLCKP